MCEVVAGRDTTEHMAAIPRTNTASRAGLIRIIPYRYVWHTYRAHLRFAGGQHVNEFYGSGSQQFSMTGLNKGQANWLTGGGSTAQGSDSEFNDALRAADKNFSEGVATTTRPNLTLLRPYH